ncbi:Hint domain-containing protein [Antarctobacter sp.]|uniref:Hint domain-containing protein n=1 Tax=Antarctobacter sp. TaxID=1872577 RepID=UPI003A94359B
MVTFSFDDPTPTRQTRVSESNFTVNFTEESVNFLWSISGGTGSNSFGFQGPPVDPNGVLFGNFDAPGTGTVFTADVSGPLVGGNPQTAFSGNVTVDFRGAGPGTNVTVAFHLVGGGTTNGLLTAGGDVKAVGNFTHITFSSTNVSQLMQIESISASSLNCFTAGTAISTPDGPVPVETLRAGDTVLTADGRKTEVLWLGRQPVDSRVMHPAKVNPVRIVAGALGGGLPVRDLRLSPDHAIALDNHLINAGALINNTTIYQERGQMPEGFVYYHVETEAHELLLAEGVAAESFIDYANRDGFVNGHEMDRHIKEMALPRISAARLVPEETKARLEADADLSRLKQRLSA